MTVKVLAVGAHPDDVELGVGGLLIKLARQGLRTGILDLSRGERSSRGTQEERKQEAGEAATALGLAVRENADLPDGEIADTPEQRRVVAQHVRLFRPEVILAPMAPDRHPDHAAAAALVRSACFEAGLHRVSLPGEPFRPAGIYGYTAYHELARMPEVVVDISDAFEAKLDVLRCYRSQFHLPGTSGPETFVSSQAFWENIRHRAAYWGGRVGVRYGEPLFLEGPLRLQTLPDFL